MFKRKKRIVVWLTLQSGLKLVLSAALILLMVLMFTYELPAARTWTYWTIPLSGKVIALDPGHGGPDGGAVSKDGLIEKEINLAITLYLRDYLQEAGAVVFMTREDDKDLAGVGTSGYSKRKTEDLINRANLINQRQADLFISVHVNSIPSVKWSGAQAFYYPNHKDNAGLAAGIQEELTHSLNNTDRIAKPAGNIFLLKTLQMPSALIEVGFLSNAEEAALLKSTTYQKKLAAAIYQGILRFYSGEKVGL